MLRPLTEAAQLTQHWLLLTVMQMEREPASIWELGDDLREVTRREQVSWLGTFLVSQTSKLLPHRRRHCSLPASRAAMGSSMSRLVAVSLDLSTETPQIMTLPTSVSSVLKTGRDPPVCFRQVWHR